MRTFVSTGFIAVARLTLAVGALAFSATAQSTPSLTTLYSFAGGSNGANPEAGVLFYAGGTLVGTTPYGGTSSYGTVYQLTPGPGGTWAQTVIYDFQGGGDGANPGAALTLGKGAVLYGTTVAGGTAGAGTVFQLTPPAAGGAWTETVLYSFQGGTDGSGPKGGVIAGKGGTLYGTTFGGGTGAAGTVFQLTPPTGGAGPWTESVIYSFRGGKDGGGPQSSLTGRNGTMFGTTCCGSEGTVFELQETAGTWTKHTIFSFTAYSAGDSPGGLVLGNNRVLYGTTNVGGSSGAGIVYSLTAPATKGKPWNLTTIHNFTGGSDGGAPYGTLALGPNGVLYGTVTVGGTDTGGGVVEFTPPVGTGQPWTETVLYNFTGLSDGSLPYAGLVLGTNNALYGTTVFGGTSGYGTVFQLTP
jgi:uncharacterized repeat protein (TIGR03803 family)